MHLKSFRVLEIKNSFYWKDTRALAISGQCGRLIGALFKLVVLNLKNLAICGNAQGVEYREAMAYG